MGGLVGDDAHRLSLEARERGDKIRRPARRYLEDRVPVEDTKQDFENIVRLAKVYGHDAGGWRRRRRHRRSLGACSQAFSGR